MNPSSPLTDKSAPSIGVDVGGTKCLGVVWSDGKIIAELRRGTPVGLAEGPGGLVEVIAEVVSELEKGVGVMNSHPPLTVGIGMPGLVTRGGVVKSSPHLPGVADLAIGALLEERLQRRAWVDNDANCAVIAEWRLGAALGADDMVLVTLGTGIGGGIISNGAVVRGAHGFAGEIGHMVIDPHGPLCPCGQRGCWERYASGSALAAQAELALGVGLVRGEDLAQMAAAGHVKAQEILDEFARWVALGLANITNMFDPSIIVIGGGLARMAPQFLIDVSEKFATMLYGGDLRVHPAIVMASLDERAGAVGAALLPGLLP